MENKEKITAHHIGPPASRGVLCDSVSGRVCGLVSGCSLYPTILGSNCYPIGWEVTLGLRET